MSKIRIGLDLYGGDNAPVSLIQGAIFALQAQDMPDLEICFMGGKSSDFSELTEKGLTNFSFTPASDNVTNDTKPTEVLKLKDSSIYIGCEKLKSKELGAVVSCGNTGALLSAGIFVAGRLPGIKRPSLVAALPGKNGKVRVLCDIGANADVKPEFLLDFAKQGNAFARFLEIENPRVGLLNNGTEEEKGSSVTKEAHQLLKGLHEINYIGYIEAREIFGSTFDVLVTDGFTGNAVLKTMEGTAYYILDEMKQLIKTGSIKDKLGGLLIKKRLKLLKSKLDYKQYGGTFLLGVNGVLVKAHGSSDAQAVYNAIKVAYRAVKDELISKISL